MFEIYSIITTTFFLFLMTTSEQFQKGKREQAFYSCKIGKLSFLPCILSFPVWFPLVSIPGQPFLFNSVSNKCDASTLPQIYLNTFILFSDIIQSASLSWRSRYLQSRSGRSFYGCMSHPKM